MVPDVDLKGSAVVGRCHCARELPFAGTSNPTAESAQRHSFSQHTSSARPVGNNLAQRLSAAYSAYVFVDTKPMSALMGTSLLKVRGKKSILGFSSVNNVAWGGAELGSFL